MGFNSGFKGLITHSLTYVHNNLLIPWSRVLLEKLTVSQLVKQFPTFDGTRRFITTFTRARHLSLSSARSVAVVPQGKQYCSLYFPVLVLTSRRQK